MGTDIYIRRARVSANNKEVPENEDMLELFLQQIEMILSTKRTQVLGAVGYGINLQYFLHDFNVNKTQINDLIREQISRYCSLSAIFSYKVFVDFFEGETSDILIVDIIVEDENIVRVIVD